MWDGCKAGATGNRTATRFLPQVFALYARHQRHTGNTRVTPVTPHRAQPTSCAPAGTTHRGLFLPPESGRTTSKPILDEQRNRHGLTSGGATARHRSDCLGAEPREDRIASRQRRPERRWRAVAPPQRTPSPPRRQTQEGDDQSFIVTRITSSMLVTPSATFSMPLCRRVFIPSAIACRFSSIAEAPLRISSRSWSVMAIIS